MMKKGKNVKQENSDDEMDGNKNGTKDKSEDKEIDSDLDDLKLEFTACQQCGKQLDDNKKSIVMHMRRAHPDEQDTWRDSHPDMFQSHGVDVGGGGGGSRKREKIKQLDEEGTIPQLDQRKQNQDRPQRQWCTICRWKFIGSGPLGKHARLYHNSMRVQIGNTFFHIDDEKNQETWAKFKYNQRCAQCLQAVSKVANMMEHMAKEHPDNKPVVYNVKGPILDNIRKVCLKSEICKDFRQTYWELDPMLSNNADALATKQDKKNGGKTGEKTVSISKELLKMIVHNLGMVQNSKAMKVDQEAGSALKDTINVLNQNLNGDKK